MASLSSRLVAQSTDEPLTYPIVFGKNLYDSV